MHKALRVLAALAILRAGAARAQTGAWDYRKTLAIPPDKDTSPVPKAALFEFTGRARPDGGDVRVYTDKNEEVPAWVVSAGPGNRYQIVFAAGEGTFFLLYGRPSATEPQTTYRPERGLLLEVYERKGNDADTVEAVRKIVENSRAGRLIGRGYRGRIWDGANPFSGDKDVVKIYTGWFYLPAPADYSFGTTSAGPSLLLIDDKVCAAWPGWHGPEAFIRPEHAGAVTLAAGRHKLSYCQISRAGREIAVAAYKPPGKDKFVVIPEDFFLSLAEPREARTEKNGTVPAAGFTWKNTHYLQREQWELFTFQFNDTSSSDSRIVQRLWNFGDGQVSTEPAPLHTYLRKGPRAVALSVKDAAGREDTVTLNVQVEQDWSQVSLPSRGHREYLDELGACAVNKYPTDELLILARLYESYDISDRAYGCYSALLARPLNRDEKYRLSLIAASLAQKAGRFKEAENIYRSLLKDAAPAEVNLCLGRLYLDLDDEAEAETQFRRAIGAPGVTADTKRKAEIGLADTCRRRGRVEDALKIYERLTDTKQFDMRNGILAEPVLYYLKSKDFSTAMEKLDAWAFELPVVKMRGHWSILLARACLLKKDYRKALTELETFRGVCLNRDNPYLGWAVYLSGEACEGLGEKARARELYNRTMADFPGTEPAKSAARRLTDGK